MSEVSATHRNFQLEAVEEVFTLNRESYRKAQHAWRFARMANLRFYGEEGLEFNEIANELSTACDALRRALALAETALLEEKI